VLGTTVRVAGRFTPTAATDAAASQHAAPSLLLLLLLLLPSRLALVLRQTCQLVRGSSKRPVVVVGVLQASWRRGVR
jgi:hypothetical protein